MGDQQDQLYQQMRGEYIGRMASLEYTLTHFTVELLGIGKRQEEFEKWFVEAPIPFSYKASLLQRLLKNDVIIKTNWPNIWKDLKELQKFRNILAHSFIGFLGYQTNRGIRVAEERVKFETLSNNLARLKELEDTISYMYVCVIEGPMPPISSDDYADWPQ